MGQTKYELPSPSRLFTPAITTFICLMVLGLGLISYFPQWVLEWMALNPQTFWRGRFWQLITYPFFDGCAWRLILEMVLILSIGSAVEREWRTRSLLTMWLLVTLATGLLWLLVCALLGRPYVLLGAGPGVFGLVAAMGLLFHGRRFLFFLCVVEAQVLAWILLGVGAILCIPSPISCIQLFGALFAYCYIKFLWWQKSQGTAYRSDGRSNDARGFVEID